MIYEDFLRCFEMLAAFNWFPSKEIIQLPQKVFLILLKFEFKFLIIYFKLKDLKLKTVK